jgi:DNA-binding PadR family transcriptional regulator
MPVERGSAEAVRYVLLGLLFAEPSYGYDLSRHFAPGTALRDVVYLGSSHLYAQLARLEREGSLAGEQQDSGKWPQKRVFRLTAAGKEAVLEWMDSPVHHPREMRIEFPLKLLVARRIDPVRAVALIDRQRQVFQAHIDRLKEASPDASPSGDDAAFLELMRLGRIGRAQEALDFLDLCAKLPQPVE